jgi:hypothetical protein
VLGPGGSVAYSGPPGGITPALEILAGFVAEGAEEAKGAGDAVTRDGPGAGMAQARPADDTPPSPAAKSPGHGTPVKEAEGALVSTLFGTLATCWTNIL